MTHQGVQKCLPLTIASESTEFYADSTEWCSLEPYEDHFVCGTYQLDDENQHLENEVQIRQGNISLYQIVEIPSTSCEYSITQKCQVHTSGVLDIKWSPQCIGNAHTIGVAFSDGHVQLLQISENEAGLTEFRSLDKRSISPEGETLALSLDWSSWKYDHPVSLIVSDSSGCLNFIGMNGTEMTIERKWKAHNFEAWIAAFDYDNRNIIYSGGDDCYFKSWDLRTCLSSPAFLQKRHTMGVTSIQKSKSHEFMLATGSYDESIYIWDTRSMKNPLSELNVGGGVWRIKWHPLYPQYLLVAAMHNGFHVLQIQNSKITVIASYMKHSSLAYGVDWTVLKQSQDCHEYSRNIVASCSFYDRSLQVWSIDLNK